MKSANVLLDNDGNVKLSDFGISMQTNKFKENQNMKGVFGTYGYMSPEAADPKKEMCKGSDVYATSFPHCFYVTSCACTRWDAS